METKAAIGWACVLLLACGGATKGGLSTSDGNDDGKNATPPGSIAGSGGQTTPAPLNASGIVGGGFTDATAMVALGPNLFVTTRSTTLQGEKTTDGGLYMLPKAGGNPLLIEIDHRGAAFDDLALEDASILVGTSDGRIERVPTYGGEATTLLTGAPAILSVASDSNHVYFAHIEGGVLQVDKDGKNPTVLATMGQKVRALGLAGTGLFVASADDASGALTRIDTQGGGMTQVAQTSGALCGLSVGSDSAYLTSLTGGVFAAKLAGGQVSDIAEQQPSPCSVAADAHNVYWLASSGANLLRSDMSGNAPVAIGSIADVVASPRALVVDDDAIYVLTKTNVVRVTK